MMLPWSPNLALDGRSRPEPLLVDDEVTSVCLRYTTNRGGTAPTARPMAHGGLISMSSKQPKPRRTRVERNIFKRADGKLEIGYRDSSGKQRWKVVEGGITAARRERDKLLGAKAKGERVQPNPRLKFGEAADRWLAEQVCELRPATRASYTN